MNSTDTKDRFKIILTYFKYKKKLNKRNTKV